MTSRPDHWRQRYAMLLTGRPAGVEQMEYNSRSFARAFASLLGGNVLGQVVWLGAAPVLTRIYDPVVFGVWLFFMSGLLVAAAVSTLRFELGIVTAESDEQARLIASAALWTTFGWALLAALAAGTVGVQALDFLEWRLDPVILLSMPALFVLVGPQQVLLNWAIRRRRFNLIAANAVVQAIALNGVAILGGLVLDAGPIDLVTASVVALLFSNGVLALALGRDFPWLATLRVPFGGVVETFRRYRRFPLYSTPYGLVAVAGNRGLDLIGGLFFGAVATGYIGLAMRVSYVPLGVITRPLNQLYFSLLSQRRNDPLVARTVYQIEVMLILAAAPTVVAIALNSVPLAQFVFGTDWDVSGSYIAWFMAPALCMLLTSWLDRTYDVVQRQRFALILETGFHLGLLVATLGVVAVWDDPLGLVVAFSLLVAAYNVVWLGITFRQAGFPRYYYPRLMMWLSGTSLLVGVVDVAVDRWAPYWHAATMVALIAIFWVVVLSRFRRFLRSEWT